MEVFALALILGMGSEINKAHDNIKMLNEQISIIRNEEIVELKERIQIMNDLDEKRTQDYLKQQEAINNLLTEIESISSRVDNVEEKQNQDFLNLTGKYASGYARHETMLSQQKLDLELMELKTDSLMEQMAIIREGVGSD